MEIKEVIIKVERIKVILAKYPNRRVHTAISELIGEDLYNMIKAMI